MGQRCNGEGDKAEWRARLARSRAKISVRQRVAEAHALGEALVSMPVPDTVCCYVPFGSEPGSLALLEVLRDGGARVLLPVIPPEQGPLDWAEYTGTGTLVPGSLRGILEPSVTRLGTASLGSTWLVLMLAR